MRWRGGAGTAGGAAAWPGPLVRTIGDFTLTAAQRDGRIECRLELTDVGSWTPAEESFWIDVRTGASGASFRLGEGIGWDLSADAVRRGVNDALIDGFEAVATHWASLLEVMASPCLDARRLADDEEALRLALTVVKRRLLANFDPHVAREARRFPRQVRLPLAVAISSDTSGRVAQLVESAPGVLLFVAAAMLHSPPAPAGPASSPYRPPLVAELLRGVSDGLPLGPLLRTVLEQFVAPRVATWNALPGVTPRPAERWLRDLRWLVRRAGRDVPLEDLFQLLPAPLEPDEVPPNALTKWLRVLRDRVDEATAHGLPPDALAGHLRFLQRHLHRMLDATRLGDQDDTGFLLLEYVAHTGARLDRTTGFHATVRAAMDLHVNAWRKSQLDAGTALPVPDPPAEVPLGVPAGADVRLFRTVGELREESVRMRHCVASYADRALEGGELFGHASVGGEELTFHAVGWRGSWDLIEVRGPDNAPDTPRGRQAIEAWLAALPPYRPPRARAAADAEGDSADTDTDTDTDTDADLDEAPRAPAPGADRFPVRDAFPRLFASPVDPAPSGEA